MFATFILCVLYVLVTIPCFLLKLLITYTKIFVLHFFFRISSSSIHNSIKHIPRGYISYLKEHEWINGIYYTFLISKHEVNMKLDLMYHRNIFFSLSLFHSKESMVWLEKNMFIFAMFCIIPLKRKKNWEI